MVATPNRKSADDDSAPMMTSLVGLVKRARQVEKGLQRWMAGATRHRNRVQLMFIGGDSEHYR